MTLQFTNNEGHAIITLCGRLDTSSAMQTQTEINQFLSTQSPILSVTVNAAELEYVSSSGLRILLSLTKQYKNFKLVEVNADVYDVLNMTGFVKIMCIERALRQMSIEGCEILGVGGVGTVYRYNDDTIIKVFRDGTTIDEVRNEITMSKEAFVMGMPTAISFDIVKVGAQYGLVYELLHADTLSSLITHHPERIHEYARMYANLFRQLHAIQVPADSCVTDALEHERKQVLHIRRYFSQENIDLLLQILDAVPAGNRLLHLDLQAKNAMVQGDELMLIDMGEVGYGHPVLDLAHAYSSLILFVGDYEAVIGMPRKLGEQLFDLTIDYYFEGQSADIIALRKQQIAAVANVRNYSWLALSDSFPEAVIQQCQQLFNERVIPHRDHILNVISTLKDWC
ncbi:TIGR02172 family protein [Xylanibacter ruminicola]|uniref:TIGR02172 family protein n=1 Tax=Xylanibacter ruminicola TaxID=839 RepID=A0A1M7CDE0_XYLRU|nr:phosphotransferase [Xylanibacter ruminicola]SHL65272.1 TIGR02172 family protein [Xylanibacter ruminicola]